MPPSPVVITFRGWKEKRAIRPWGLPIPIPAAVHADLAAGSACGILDQGNAVATCDRNERGEIARHPHLVDRDDRACAGRDRFGHVVRIDVDEDGGGAAISDAIGGRGNGWL
jgi:hypothetical protein